jgi:hypothetical protein
MIESTKSGHAGPYTADIVGARHAPGVSQLAFEKKGESSVTLRLGS